MMACAVAGYLVLPSIQPAYRARKRVNRTRYDRHEQPFGAVLVLLEDCQAEG